MTDRLLDPYKPVFPPARLALEEPAGLLAVGGNLLPETLMTAYRQGIFPWFDQGSPFCWWSPDPREVLLPGRQHWSRSMRKYARSCSFELRTNTAFEQVMRACSRRHQGGFWITDEMIDAYASLHRAGYAHSLEAWRDDQLLGGLYGVQVGAIFCGESMFHRESNVSKLVFLCLADQLFQRGYHAIDCQFATDHLRSLGSQPIARADYLKLLAKSRDLQPGWRDQWQVTMLA